MFGFQFRALTLIIILLPALANAEIYRWTDETGKVHYSDKKPAGITAEKKAYVNVATPWRKVPRPERTADEQATDDVTKQEEATVKSQTDEELSKDKNDKQGNKKTKRLKAKLTSDDVESSEQSEPVRLNQKDKSSYTPAKRVADIKETYKKAKEEYHKDN